MSTDRIEKSVVLKAPVAQVWKAIGDSAEFSRWFGVEMHGPFVAGAEVRGTFKGSFPEAEIQASLKKKGLPVSGVRMPEPRSVFCVVERVEPERFLSFRWHPYGIDAEMDAAKEPMTLVEFRLTSQGDGTLLQISESGFDALPAFRRARAFHMNDGGWSAQAENVRRHVEGH